MQYGIISLLLYKKERIFEKFSEDDHEFKQVEDEHAQKCFPSHYERKQTLQSPQVNC